MTKKFLILCFWLLCYSVAKCQDEQSIDKDAERREGNAQDGGNGRNIVLFIKENKNYNQFHILSKVW
jgi:hypothetical protein